MNSPKSVAATTTGTSPLRESTRNAPTEGVTPSNSWSTTSSTSSFRTFRRDSPLTSDAIPNHHYHRLPAQLARRQSASYNHVRNNNLVTKSPFKVHNAFKPSRIPTPSRATTKDDENKPEFGFKRRQSRGLQGLFKEQAVTNSPFLGEKHVSVECNATPIRSAAPPPSKLPISRAMTSPEIHEPRPATPPEANTPCNSRLSSVPSPKSSLVSPKRLRGPRSLSTSPGSENARRQRRKTVTFDERCDVLEFDEDDVSEVVMTEDDGEDDYGLPELPSPAVSASTEGSFISDTGELSTSSSQKISIEEYTADVNIEHPGRMPRISRDEIRRRLMEHREEELQERDLSSPQHTSDASFDISSQSLDPKLHWQAQKSLQGHLPDVNQSTGASFDLTGPGVDLSEVHSALDRLMLGVECGFGLNLVDSESLDGGMDGGTAPDGDLSVGVTPSTILSNLSADVVDIDTHEKGEMDAHHQKVQMADISEALNTDEDMGDPASSSLNDDKSSNFGRGNGVLPDAPTVASLPGTPTQHQGSPLPANHQRSTLAGTAVVDLSITSFVDDAVRTSTPPISQHKDQQPSESSSQHRLAPSLSIPPLSFDLPFPDTQQNNLGSSVETVHSPQFPKAVRDDTFLVRSASITSNESIPPPVPPKDHDVIEQTDDFVDARRREMRAEYQSEHPPTSQAGRPSRRRSLSTGDAEDLGSSKPAAQRRADRLRDNHDLKILDVPLEQAAEDDALANVIERELKIRKRPTVKDKSRKYQLRERENTIYASADDKVSHMSRAGDVDSGKAWRAVRRPSDMNEYSRQIKEYRAQQKPGKVHGKVFVKVLGVRGLNIPLPAEPTVFTCTLNNGIHFVTTPECRLGKDSRIEQEFELIEHSKLEFTLTLKVRRDPHIAAQTKPNSTSAVPIAAAPPASTSRGVVRSFFGVGSSPKKAHKVAAAAVARGTSESVEDNLARYLRPDGTLARSFISFKEIAKRCDTRLFETSFPLIGQRMDDSNTTPNPWTMGEIVLQIFRLPPLPGIPPDQLPQSLEECHRGLRHINWHKVMYHEGVLTQCGGDCRTWRRRLLRVIGSNLIAFNDVTKKATATIDLKKAIDIEDDDRASGPVTSPASAATARSRDEFDEVYRVERSFRLIFPKDEEISFFADNDEAKARWLEVFRALVGHIPPNPLWAELVWQRQEELAKNPLPSSTSDSASLAPRQAAPNPR